jgi:hypothetical protein
MNRVSEQKDVRHKQEARVNQLTVAHEKAKQQLDTKMKEKEGLVKQLVKHEKCITTLQDLEVKATVAGVEYKRQRVLYLQGHHDGIWAAKDELAKTAFDLFLTQTWCKPSGVKIAPIPEPDRCDSDTGGSCTFMACKEERHATCAECPGILPCLRRCVCPVGSCAKAGACVDRPDPLVTPTDLLAVENVTLAAEQPALVRPEPPKATSDLLASRPPASSVGPAGVPGVVLVPACLAVMVVVLAAATGRRFRAARKVRLADTCLG